MRAARSPSDELIADAENARVQWIQTLEEAERQKRARAFDKLFKDAERCTKFFLRRPRARGNNTIPGVRMNNGDRSNDRSRIMWEHTKFWSGLYSASSDNTEPAPSYANIESLTNIELPQLTPDAAQSLEEEITADDITRQITRLPKNKAAGADGLRAELLQQNPTLWADALLPIFETCIHKDNNLPKLFRDSIIILLHKKGCNLQPRNYRPIALLNVVAKLLTKVHNERLKKVIASIIPPEQTGFVPDRSISENVILLQDAIFYAKRHHPSAIILSLDFEKAYDRIQWKVMTTVMEKMNFGPRWLSLITTLYKQREAKLSINGELSRDFTIQRGVLQGDPLSPALFILTCSPLYAMINMNRRQHGIPLQNGKTAPVACFYADDTNLIAKSPESAVSLYNVAVRFCELSGAKIHPQKCVAIPSGPAPPTLSNGIRILSPEQHTTLLGIPMGMSITRKQQTEKILVTMIQRCHKWAHVGRTVEGRITIARAIILPSIWYLMGALPIDRAESKKIQSAIFNYVKGKEAVEWNAPTKAGNIPSGWFTLPKWKEGWGLEQVSRTLKMRKLTLLRRFLNDKANGRDKPWHTFASHMVEEHLNSWCKNWQGILFWRGSPKQGGFGLGDWRAVSPWWRDAWSTWLNLRCTPARKSQSRSQLTEWPVWNNRLLMTKHGLDTTLAGTFSNSDTRVHMAVIRSQGFLNFEDFLNDNGTLLTAEDLYNKVLICLSVNNVDHIVPRSACHSLMKYIAALWRNTVRRWERESSIQTPQRTTEWWPPTGGNNPFSTANNKAISRMVSASEPPPKPLRLINLHEHPVSVNWKREKVMLRPLAPSRRDLIMRLIRNALPLGVKRVHWDVETQTRCMLCETNVVETASHLFWECTFARDTWGRLVEGWRNNQNNTQLGWKEVLVGYEVRLADKCNKQIEQLWAIIRACTVRVIWFERNRRYFYADLQTRSATYRHNQSKDDIRAHVDSWLRRAAQKEKENIINAITALKSNNSEYNMIDTNPTITHQSR